MNKLFKNLGYAIATMVAAFALLALLPGSIGVFQVAQATPTPCPGELDIDGLSMSWELNDKLLDYVVRVRYDLGGESSAVITIYDVNKDNTLGAEIRSDTETENGSTTIINIDQDRSGSTDSWNPVKFKVKMERTGCADMWLQVNLPMPNTGSGSGAEVDVNDETERVVDLPASDRLDFDVVTKYDSSEYSGLDYEFWYLEDSEGNWNEAVSKTPYNNPTIDDNGEPLYDHSEVQILVDKNPDEEHVIKVKVFDGTNLLDSDIIVFED